MMSLSLLFSVLSAATLPIAGQQISTPAATPVHILAPLYSVVGANQYDRLGYSLDVIIDVDGDGLGDILLGAPNRIPPTSTMGHAWVISAQDGTLLREHSGTNYGDRFGRAVSLFPDLDQDGTADYAVGATWAEDPPGGYGAEQPGTATIFSGATGELIMVLGGFVAGECFGGGLAALDDVTGDGLPDFAIGSRFGGAVDADPLTAPGKVRIFSTAAWLPVFEVSGSNPGDFLAGEATVALPDQDGDGHVDIASGAWGYPDNAKQGQVLVISGAKGTVIRTFEGEATGDHFGLSLAPLPDVDGDDLADLMIGAPQFGAANTGRAYVVSVATGSVLAIYDGHSPGEMYGASVGSAGDQNGDGTVDYLIGAPEFMVKRGRVDVVSGATGGVLASAVGRKAADMLGFAVEAVPDINGDGEPELAVSAIGYPDDTSHGQVTVFTMH